MQAELFDKLCKVQMELAAARYARLMLDQKADEVSLNKDRDSLEYARAIRDRANIARYDINRLVFEERQVDVRTDRRRTDLTEPYQGGIMDTNAVQLSIQIGTRDANAQVARLATELLMEHRANYPNAAGVQKAFQVRLLDICRELLDCNKEA